MNPRSVECKDNNAANVKRMMPGMLWEPWRWRPKFRLSETVNNGQKAQ